VVIRDERGGTVFAGGFYLGTGTNNAAEYEALLRAMKLAERLGGTELDILCDSELIVKQVNGQYRVKNAKLRRLFEEVTSRMRGFARVSVGHVRWENNSEADSLANRAMDSKSDVGGMVAGSADSQDAGAGAGGFLAVRDLAGWAIEDGAGVRKERLMEEGRIRTALFIVRPGHRCRLKPRTSEAMLTVVQGRGTVSSGGEGRTVGAPCWVRVRVSRELDLVAEGDRQLMVAVTGWEGRG